MTCICQPRPLFGSEPRSAGLGFPADRRLDYLATAASGFPTRLSTLLQPFAVLLAKNLLSVALAISRNAVAFQRRNFGIGVVQLRRLQRDARRSNHVVTTRRDGGDGRRKRHISAIGRGGGWISAAVAGFLIVLAVSTAYSGGGWCYRIARGQFMQFGVASVTTRAEVVRAVSLARPSRACQQMVRCGSRVLD
jgi:hypothetical protein